MNSVMGIDEVGRGCLAGPVVVAAAMVCGSGTVGNAKLGALKDSKKLTPKQRAAWFAYFKNSSRITYAVARVYPRQIEALNISRAANLAAYRAFSGLMKQGSRLNKRKGAISVVASPNASNPKVFLDGGLYLKSKKDQPKNAKTVVKGDEKIPAVAIASIIAKMTRDALMVRLGKKYPNYGFAIHKGYGTRMHKAALRKYGPIEAHRLTFLGKKVQ